MGSEMCIRDSTNFLEKKTARDFKDKNKNANGVVGMMSHFNEQPSKAPLTL